MACSGSLRVRSAIYNFGGTLTADFGADGTRGGSPSFEEYMVTAAGQAEVCVWQERIAAQVQTELCRQPGHLAPGALQADSRLSFASSQSRGLNLL